MNYRRGFYSDELVDLKLLDFGFSENLFQYKQSRLLSYFDSVGRG